MTEKPQPLTEEKIKTILLRVDTNKYGKEKVVKLKDLKLAIEWLLKYIDDLWKESEEKERTAEKRNNQIDVAYEYGYQSALSDVKEIVREAFEVMKK